MSSNTLLFNANNNSNNNYNNYYNNNYYYNSDSLCIYFL
jgi:hypothetical protein